MNIVIILYSYSTFFGFIQNRHCHAERLSSKLGFEEDSDKDVVENNDSSKAGDDVEVQHTIIVTTKLKNNIPNTNPWGFRESPTSFVNSGNNRHLGPPHRRRGNDDRAKAGDNDSGDVPIIKGYKAVETTERRPSSRSEIPDVYPDMDSILIVANVDRDQVNYEINPSDISSGNQWQASTFFRNINSYAATPEYFSYDIPRSNGANSRNMVQGSTAGSRGSFQPQIAAEPWNVNCCKCRDGGRQPLVGWNLPGGEISTKASVDGKIVKPFN